MQLMSRLHWSRRGTLRHRWRLQIHTAPAPVTGMWGKRTYITKYIKQHLANFKIYSVLSHSYPPPHRTAANSCKNGKSASMLQKFCSRVSVSLRIFLQPGHRHQGQDRGHEEDPRHNAAPHLKLRQHRGSSSTAAGKSIVQLCLQYCHLNNLH